MALSKDTTPSHSSYEEEVENEEEEEQHLEARGDPTPTPSPSDSDEEEGQGKEEASPKTAANKFPSPTHKYVRNTKKRTAKSNDSKQKKMKVVEETAGTSMKVNPNARKFGEDDDLKILKGLSAWEGGVPLTKLKRSEFLDYIQESLSYKFDSEEMLRNKLNRLKAKYVNINSRTSKPSKPHDLQCYELMKMIWGKEVDNNSRRSAPVLQRNTRSAKAQTSHVSADIPSSSKEVHKVASTDIPSSSKEVQVQEVDLSAHPLLDAFCKDAGNLEIVEEVFWEKGLALLEDAEAKKFQKKLRKLHNVKSKLNMRYKKLVRNLMTSLSRA